VTSHFTLLVVFSACVATVFGTLLRDETRPQLRLAARIFGALVLGACALGWIMYALFG
jgi:hypothetical protein